MNPCIPVNKMPKRLDVSMSSCLRPGGGISLGVNWSFPCRVCDYTDHTTSTGLWWTSSTVGLGLIAFRVTFTFNWNFEVR